VLPAPARLRARADFAATVRAGRRGRSGLLLAHVSTPAAATDDVQPPGAVPVPARPARAGFVVSRAVGGAVVRNQVKRRLRALTAERLQRLPAGCSLVVRALPDAASASSLELGRALDRALSQALASPRSGRNR
jgi:ribonuclease P protein component